MKKGRLIIDRNICKGCYLCLAACPRKLLVADTETTASGVYPAKIQASEKCIACGNCYTICPDAAITVFEVTNE
jgi:2-oxoglutarate ferredoxin oxidoreductase subunit delta